MQSRVALDRLKAAVADLHGCDFSDLADRELGDFIRDLRCAQDAQEEIFSRAANTFTQRGGHHLDGSSTAVGWIRNNCKMTSSSASDRLCLGKQLEEMPRVAEALVSGVIGFQSASVLCHLREQLGEKGPGLDEEWLLDAAVKFSVHDLRYICRQARHQIDPDGFDRGQEEDFERRWLRVSQLMDGMFAIDGVLDHTGGAAIRTALDALNQRHGAEDDRSFGQRNADALVEMTFHALEKGTLPTVRGVKPHINLTTSLESLKREVGAPAVELEFSLPVSAKTLQRFACDCTMSRVLLADSTVIDVGRATRTVSPPTRRALGVRDKHCGWPGCDRPLSWTSAHHVEFWGGGGRTKVSNLLSLCYIHHRNVHEGGWQVIAHGKEFRFLPPPYPQTFGSRHAPTRFRRWAA